MADLARAVQDAVPGTRECAFGDARGGDRALDGSAFCRATGWQPTLDIFHGMSLEATRLQPEGAA